MMHDWSLGELTEPRKFSDPVEIPKGDQDKYLNALGMLMRIRAVERKLADARRDGLVKGPVHLGVGQEAIPTGISMSLTKHDRVFGGHRSHGHVLALGGDVRKLFSEVLGRSTGLSKGMGGSMHLIDRENGFYGSTPIVAGTIPLAVGAALAAKLQKKSAIGVAYLGDGAAEEGVFHEALNFASINQLPMLFVVENNLFASHMHISLRQPKSSSTRFAEANDIPYKLLDGNDIVQMTTEAGRLVNEARNGGGPRLIEAVTYRWYGHVDWREDIDVGVNRSSEELAAWRERDPVERLKKGLLQFESVDSKNFDQIEAQINEEIETAWNQAIGDPYPDQKVDEHVYYQGGI